MTYGQSPVRIQHKSKQEAFMPFAIHHEVEDGIAVITIDNLPAPLLQQLARAGSSFKAWSERGV